MHSNCSVFWQLHRSLNEAREMCQSQTDRADQAFQDLHETQEQRDGYKRQLDELTARHQLMSAEYNTAKWNLMNDQARSPPQPTSVKQENGTVDLVLAREEIASLRGELADLQTIHSSMAQDVNRIVSEHQNAHSRATSREHVLHKLISELVVKVDVGVDMSVRTLRKLEQSQEQVSALQKQLGEEKGRVTGLLEVRERECELTRYYAVMNPSKLNHVSEMALRNLDKLNNELRARYGGLDLTAPHQELVAFIEARSATRLNLVQLQKRFAKVNADLEQAHAQTKQAHAQTTSARNEIARLKAEVKRNKDSMEHLANRRKGEAILVSKSQKEVELLRSGQVQ
jgi:Holliday junction resolvase-like predicted endonuclease